MEVLGGGGPQTLFGYQLIRQQEAQVGLSAGVGSDLPDACKEWLQGIGCDLSGLITSNDLPTPRAWQVLEADGRRTQVWRSPEGPQLYQQLRPSFDQLPPSFQAARSYHIGIHASYPPMTLLRQLRDAAHINGGLLSVEPYMCCDTTPPPEKLRELLQLCDIFSPNQAEAASILGLGPGAGGASGGNTGDGSSSGGGEAVEYGAQMMVAGLMDAGAAVVALRRGPLGALVAERSGGGDMWRVPAVPELQVVDPTGCGNAFCGGLLAARMLGRSLADSAAWGCVAGSIMAEWQGVPSARPGDERLQKLASGRVAAVLERARRVPALQARAMAAPLPTRVATLAGRHARKHIKIRMSAVHVRMRSGLHRVHKC